MGACVMFNKLETMNHLNTKIPNFFNKEAELSSTGNSLVLIVAAMFSSVNSLNFLVDTVIPSKTTVSSSIQRKLFSSAINVLSFLVNHCIVFPKFKSEVSDETGKLGSKYPSNLFLTACEFGNLNAVKYCRPSEWA